MAVVVPPPTQYHTRDLTRKVGLLIVLMILMSLQRVLCLESCSWHAYIMGKAATQQLQLNKEQQDLRKMSTIMLQRLLLCSASSSVMRCENMQS